jgi:hypothetical protein
MLIFQAVHVEAFLCFLILSQFPQVFHIGGLYLEYDVKNL